MDEKIDFDENYIVNLYTLITIKPRNNESRYKGNAGIKKQMLAFYSHKNNTR